MRKRQIALALIALAIVGVVDAALAAAPEATKYDLNGMWKTNRGDLRITQSATALTGSMVMSNGSMGKFDGKFEGEKLNFTWSVNGQKIGSGTLKTGDNGFHWSGPYTLEGKTTSTIWNMGRPPTTPPVAKSPRPARGNLIDVTGHWKSNILGPIDLVQTQQDVTGDWHAMPGISMELTGTLTDYQLTLKMGLADLTAGSGTLQLSNDQQQLKGTYHDERTGIDSPWTLIRDDKQ